MKRTITQVEFECIDRLATVADGLAAAQTTLCQSIERQLGVDDWDHEVRAQIRNWVVSGCTTPLETFAEQLSLSIRPTKPEADRCGA